LYSSVRTETIEEIKQEQERKSLKLQKSKLRVENFLPPGFRISLMIEFNLVPGEKINRIVKAIEEEISKGNLERFNTDFSYYFNYIKEVGLENIISEAEK
jgi:hypothetical protein